MVEMILEAKVENLDLVIEFVENQLASAACPAKVQVQIDVAVEELFVNIASYAYPKDQPGTATIQVEIREDPLAAEITFIDRGIPYNPLMKKDPNVTLSLEERQIGGLGIYMVKKSMDDVRYAYRDGQNILTIYKLLS